jgi:hypothetical protein
MCLCVFKRGRLGGVFPVQQVLASPWRKSVSAGGDVQRVLQSYAAADQDFLHEGQRPYASADQTSPSCWAVVIPQDPSGEPDLTPDSPRSRTPASRNRNYLVRSLGVVLSSSAILATFFNTVFVIGSYSDLTRKDESTGSRNFFCSSLFTSGLYFYFLTFHP